MLAGLYREHASLLRDRERNARRIHPELATPQLMAFWMSQLTATLAQYATFLDGLADDLEGNGWPR